MHPELEAWIAIALVTMATLATRFLGPVLMARVPLTERVQRFLEVMSISVLVAIVASFLARGGPREVAALVAGAAAMIVFRRPLAALACSVAVAAAWSNLGF